mmetsp:Transcript_4380/g.9130  ORF Transcript_4380/g.9130 Transcript_4380/m.9130 type:complete len:88 (-) Transcript_4380:1977-2240(-)
MGIIYVGDNTKICSILAAIILSYCPPNSKSKLATSKCLYFFAFWKGVGPPRLDLLFTSAPYDKSSWHMPYRPSLAATLMAVRLSRSV